MMHPSAMQSTPSSAEAYLAELLVRIDRHSQQAWHVQGALLNTLDQACRRALGENFDSLVLVGSAALLVTTPGSDLDVVCFTRPPEDCQTMSKSSPRKALQRVHQELQTLELMDDDFRLDFLQDARVPILRVHVGPMETETTVDILVDKKRPVDHLRWFEQIGAAPRPAAPAPFVTPLVTLTLRCVKWWLKQREIPRTKEGGLPTLVWLLLAVHSCSLPDTHARASINGVCRPTAALIASLGSFFDQYAGVKGLDGTLAFSSDGFSSEFHRRTESLWPKLQVLDPTLEGDECLDLVPKNLTKATQLLLAYELTRASQRLRLLPRGGREALVGAGRRTMEELFTPAPAGVNVLPASINGDVGALMLRPDADDFAKKDSQGCLELVVLESATPREGWAAPFLQRLDGRSRLEGRICDFEEKSGRCYVRKANAEVSRSPRDFICQVSLEKDGRGWRLDAEGTQRYRAMKRLLCDLPEAAACPAGKAALAKRHGVAAPPERSRGWYTGIVQFCPEV